jgi:Family of unknown function (DUF6353)
MKDLLMKTFPKKMLGTVARQVLLARKNSPHIFFGIGVAGSIVSTVLACRSTMRLSDTLDEIQKEVDQLKPDAEILVEQETTGELIIAENPHKNVDTIYVYARASLKLVRLYAPAAVVGTLSIASLANSHVILVRRNAALMAAYATLQKAYDAYRARVREEVGEEKELDLYRGTEVVKNDDNTINGKTVDPEKWSPYARFFDEGSKHWQKDPEYNRMHLTVVLQHFNNRLNAYGHVFLNEVYDALGLDRSKAGSVVGWLRFPEDGDGYIDFGITDVYKTAAERPWERSYLLDFNVDGVIYDKI